MARTALSPATAPALTGRELWRQWTLFTTMGEVAGFAVPSAAGAIAYALDAPAVLMYLALVAAGSLEGAALGFGQHRALGRALPAVRRGAWVASTGAAAAVAWAAGMLPGTLEGLGVPMAVAMSAWAPAGVVILLSIGGAQWFVLRRHVPGAGRWVPANIAAWLVALPAPFVGLALVPNGAPWWAWAVAGVASGLVMAAAVAAITGWALTQLLEGRLMAAGRGAS